MVLNKFMIPLRFKEWTLFKENSDVLQSALSKLESKHRLVGNDWTGSIPLQKDMGLTQPEYDSLFKMNIIKKEPSGLSIDHNRLTSMFPLLIGRIFPS